MNNAGKRTSSTQGPIQMHCSTLVGNSKASFTQNRADDARLSQLIKEAAAGSEFSRKEEEKKLECEDRVRKYRAKIKCLKGMPDKWSRMKHKVDQLVDCIRKERVVSRTWIHIDMDMFFAAVEIKDDPSLAD